MNLRVKRLHPDAKIPVKTTEGASCFDLSAVEDGVIPPGGRALIKTGLAMAVERGFEVQVRSRSGLALKHGVSVLNSPGTVDSDYRGEVGVILINNGDKPFSFSRGDRVAQAAVVQVAIGRIEEVQTLEDTERGVGGFGSTGVS